MDETRTQHPVRVVKLPGVPPHADASQYYFPINIDQVRDLEDSLATRLEMMSLSKKAEDAAKLVFQEQLWQWFSDAQDNSTTSYKGCIAPVVCTDVKSSDESKLYPSNRWGFTSEEEYINYTTPKMEGVSDGSN